MKKINIGLVSVVENYFQTVTKKSWTWQKLTEEEKERFIKMDFDGIKGTAQQRKQIFHMIYFAFLVGCGYDGLTWRDSK